MLYQFLLNFVDTFGFLNVFKYLTFRTGLSLFTSFIIVLIIGAPFIKFFSNKKILRPKLSEVTDLQCDNQKIKNLSNWNSKVNLDNGLKKTIQWIKKNYSKFSDKYEI